MTFDLPLLAAAAPLVALVLGLAGWWARRRRVRAAERWSPSLAERERRDRRGPVVLALVGGLATVGAAGPRWGVSEFATESRALSLVIAIDISRSMLAEDVGPSRLGRAIRESRRLLQDARGDRLALIAFAGRSYILTPLTLDDGAVELQLDALDPDVASEGGTALAAMLRQGRELLEAVDEGGARALVVFTDGEAHDSLPGVRAAARELRGAGVTLIVVGAGGITPVRIPRRDDAGNLTEYQKDASGAEVFTARREDILRSMADAGEGILVPADFPDQAGAVWKTLAALDRASSRGRRTEDLVPRAWWLALGGFLALLAQAALRRRATLIGLAACALLPAAVTAQRPVAGAARLRARDTTRAIVAFATAARAGRAADTSWFNAGTAALAAAQYPQAREALGAAAESLDPAVRFKALYNLGLVALREARADSGRRDALEQEAAQHFRDALTLDPGSRSAKWNLELVSRRPPPPTPNQPQPSPQGGGGSTAPPRPDEMSASEADQILRSVERAEQRVRADQLRRRRLARSAADKDW